MTINQTILRKPELQDEIVTLFTDFFGFEKTDASKVYNDEVLPHLQNLKDDLHYLVESPYVDKVYRDSFYCYFSSKFSPYQRDCIRLSIFNGEIQEDDFRDPARIIETEKKFLGFVVLRPTYPSVIGRSIISKYALNNSDFLCLSTKFDAAVNFVKFQVDGFPHSSQDSETISCAETTLWAMMEYFGYRYAEYNPVLPSKIIGSLRTVSMERQVPSRGLNIQQISFALKEFGLSSRIYSKARFGTDDFKKLFATYVESGLPLIVAIQGGGIGHALLCIGHERTEHATVDALAPSIESDLALRGRLAAKNITIYDDAEVNRKYVFIDDNHPIYQLAYFATPAAHYSAGPWQLCEIEFFIVPLYQKIYLEAYEAKLFIKKYLIELFPIPNDSELYLRFYLTSSRTYKNDVAVNTTMDTDTKDLILGTSMSKFIWVCEVSTKDLIKQQKAEGIFLADATEARTENLRPLILATYKDKYVYPDHVTKKLTSLTVASHAFSIFTGNLKGF